MQQNNYKSKIKASKKFVFDAFLHINVYLFLFRIDLAIGINTKAPDRRMDIMSMPSMRGDAVSIKKQSAAHRNMRATL